MYDAGTTLSTTATLVREQTGDKDTEQFYFVYIISNGY